MKKVLLAAVLLMPAVASAQTVRNLEDVLNFVLRLISAVIPIIIALAVLVFIWGVFRYVVSSDEEAKAKGKNMILWGIVGLFVMVSVWGLVNILVNTFNLEQDAPDGPELPRGDNPPQINL
jgi:hypothetical protein